jgi:hypothetical protein
MSRSTQRILAGSLFLGLALLTFTGCSTGVFGTPDTSNDPIPPARPSPFSDAGSDSSSPGSSQALRF